MLFVLCAIRYRLRKSLVLNLFNLFLPIIILRCCGIRENMMEDYKLYKNVFSAVQLFQLK